MNNIAQRAAIEFHSDATYVGPLTWGQRSIWKAITWLGEGAYYFNIRRVVQLPQAAPVDRVLDALRRLIDRHEALRSRWYLLDGEPVQEVVAGATIEVSILDVGDGGAQAAARKLGAGQTAPRLPNDDGMPAWAGLVTKHGLVQAVVLVITHQAIDAWSARILERHLLEYIDNPDAPQKPAWQPRDQAEWERTDAGRNRSESSLRYWERTLRTAPAAMFGARPTAEVAQHERFIQLGMDSRALAAGATALAAACGVSVSTVLLAATAAVLGQVTGSPSVVMQLISVNRVDPRTEGLVAAVAADALFTLEVGGVAFPDLVRAARQRAMLAYRNARYDPVAKDGVVASAAAERGESIDLTSYFNDGRMNDGWPSLPPLPSAPGEARALAKDTSVYYVGAWDRQDSAFFASAAYAPDVARYLLLADTVLVPRPVMTSCLRDVETLVLEAAIKVACRHA
jgi:hypothetical protein